MQKSTTSSSMTQYFCAWWRQNIDRLLIFPATALITNVSEIPSQRQYNGANRYGVSFVISLKHPAQTVELPMNSGP